MSENRLISFRLFLQVDTPASEQSLELDTPVTAEHGSDQFLLAVRRLEKWERPCCMTFQES